MKIVQGKLFPTPVWAVQLDDAASLNRDLARSIEALRQKDPRGVSRTNVLGWQTLPELQNLPEFKVFIDTVLDVARQIGGSMKIRDDVEYRIEAWANVSQTGAYNVIHNHPNCHLSGSYYVRTPVGCGDIFFRDPRSGAGICVPPVHEGSDFTQKDMAMQAQEGTMYIFPAWLDHGTEPNGSNEDRICIAFNVSVREKT